MSRAEFQILATLYDLLAKYSEEDLIEASRQRGISRNLRTAIRALASETRQGELLESKSPPRPRATARHYSKGDKNLSPDLPPEMYKRNLQAFLSNKARFRTKKDILRLADRLGFPLDAPAKDSRSRTVSKVVHYALDTPAFREKLYEIVPNGSSRETQGWLQLILGEE